MSSGPSPDLVRLAAAVAGLSPVPERVLQVECGDGEGVLFLAREFPSSRVRGIDRSAEAIRAAVGRVGLNPEGRVAFKVGGPRRLPYPDGFFDLVIQQGGHPAPQEIARVLHPGGHFVFIHDGPPGRAERIGRKLLLGRLARHGVTLVRAEGGAGNFLVARLGERVDSPADI